MIRTVRLLGTVCALVAAPVAGAQAPDPEVINAAWLERQQKVISAEFDIRVEAFYSKDAISAQIANSPFQPSRMKGHTIPAEDRHCVYTARFVLHGRKLRLEVDGDRWTGSHFGQFGETFVFTERGKRELQNDPARSPAGYVRNQADYLQARLETFRPLTRCLRAGGADAIDDLSAGLLAPAGQKAAIKGVECLPFRETASGDGVRTYWLCPSRDWVLARETFTIPASGARTEFDTAFVRHESGVWVPSSWEVRTTFAGKPTSMTKKFTVVKYTLNGEPERGAFDLSFSTSRFPLGPTCSTRIGADTSPVWCKRMAVTNPTRVPTRRCLRPSRPNSGLSETGGYSAGGPP